MSPPGTAVAWKNTAVPFIVTAWVLGETVMEFTPDSTTETDDVPVHAEHPPDEAVIVAVPDCTPVAIPEVCPIDTVVASLEDQTTPEVSVFWLPSLKVPVAVIWNVSFTLRDNPEGPTETPVNVGFTKKPRQLVARAKVASAAKAPISRSFCFVDDILVDTPWARACSVPVPFFEGSVCKNCSREDFALVTTAVPELQARNHLCHSPLSILFSFRTPSQSPLAKKRHAGPSRFSWSKRENGQRRGTGQTICLT